MKTALLLLIVLSGSISPAFAAEVTLKVTIDAPDEGTATLKIDTEKKTWAGTNDSGSTVLSILSGDYVYAAANTVPGFATKGTMLVKSGGSAKKADDQQVFLKNFDPGSTTPKTGGAQALKTAGLGTWSR